MHDDGFSGGPYGHGPAWLRCLAISVSNARMPYSQNIRTRLSVGDYLPYHYPRFGLFSAPSSPILRASRGPAKAEGSGDRDGKYCPAFQQTIDAAGVTRVFWPYTARLWLAVAVATLWLLSVGGEAEATIPASLKKPTPERGARGHGTGWAHTGSRWKRLEKAV